MNDKTISASPEVNNPYDSDHPFVTVKILDESLDQISNASLPYTDFIHKINAKPDGDVLGS